MLPNYLKSQKTLGKSGVFWLCTKWRNRLLQINVNELTRFWNLYLTLSSLCPAGNFAPLFNLFYAGMFWLNYNLAQWFRKGDEKPTVFSLFNYFLSVLPEFTSGYLYNIWLKFVLAWSQTTVKCAILFTL